jgi:hypothetical protein
LNTQAKMAINIRQTIQQIHEYISKSLDQEQNIIPSLETIEKRFLPDVSQYKDEVMIVFLFFDARKNGAHLYAYVLMDKEQQKWWDKNGHLRVELLNYYAQRHQESKGKFNETYDYYHWQTIENPYDIHNLETSIDVNVDIQNTLRDIYLKTKIK